MKSAGAEFSAREIAGIHLAQCRAILNMDSDPWRLAWDAMTQGQRRVLLALGDQSPAFYAGAAWVDLPARCRSAVMAGARRVRDVLGRVPA